MSALDELRAKANKDNLEFFIAMGSCVLDNYPDQFSKGAAEVYAALLSQLAAKDARIAELENAVVWALGYTDFGVNRGLAAGAFWWRDELAQKAKITPLRASELAAALKVSE